MNQRIDSTSAPTSIEPVAPTEELEALHPETLEAETTADDTGAESQDDKPTVTVSDILKDPASTAYSFMKKAQDCMARGDTAGYFAYHDHAMTWAQNEATARNS